MDTKNESITNKIHSEISNTVQNLTGTINNIVNKVTKNNLKEMVDELKLSGNSDIEAENKAIISIISSGEFMSKLADKIASDVIINAGTSMSPIFAIANVQQQSGGPDQMVDGIIKGLSQIGDGSIDPNISETEIKNRIKIDILDRTIKRNDIEKFMQNTIQKNTKFFSTSYSITM